MVPSGEITDAVITELGTKLDAGDLVIDGGNSRFTEDQKHGAALAEKGIRFADCGVSGGVWGLQNGYGLMAGGDAADIERALPVFDALRPAGERPTALCTSAASAPATTPKWSTTGSNTA